MTADCYQLAESMTLQAFANSYLREIDAGVWHPRESWRFQYGHRFDGDEGWVLELRLPLQQSTLAFNVHYRSLVGPHRLGQVYVRHDSLLQWRPLQAVCVLQLLIAEIYTGLPLPQRADGRRTELSSRVLGSIATLSQFLQRRQHDPRLTRLTFIDSEQSVLFGHWLHPAPKSRQGMHDWHHDHYSPEMAGRFQLFYFVAERQLVEEKSLLPESASERLHRALLPELVLSPAEVLLPVHPLQADWLQHQPHVRQWLASGRLRALGPMGPCFQATSSVRTVYSAELDFMLKLSLPVKITNSCRFNKRHELDAGLYVGALLTCLETELETELESELARELGGCGFEVIRDPAYITLVDANSENHVNSESGANSESHAESGFEVILRDNPFAASVAQGRQQVSLAALLQEPVSMGGQSRLQQVIAGLCRQERRSVADVSRDWFDHYWRCAVEPLIVLYDRYGLALEAHQQNSLLDISGGYPERYYYRDNQGFYLAESQRQSLLQRVPELQTLQSVFYADTMIQQRFTYYLVVNQLFAVIHRFGVDGLLPETELLARARAGLQQLLPRLNGPAVDLVRALLLQPRLPCKANLRTRIEDVDELAAELEMAIYGEVDNPLLTVADGAAASRYVAPESPSMTTSTVEARRVFA